MCNLCTKTRFSIAGARALHFVPAKSVRVLFVNTTEPTIKNLDAQIQDRSTNNAR